MSRKPLYEAFSALNNIKSNMLNEAIKDEDLQEEKYIVSDEVSDDLSELRGYNLRAETYGAGRYKVIGNYDELVRWIKSTRRDQRWIDSTIKSIRKLNDKKARKSRLDPLKAAKKHFEKSVDFEAEDFRSYDAYDEYLEYLDLGPEDFYYTFEDDFDWNPDFVAKYGSDIEESCNTEIKEATNSDRKLFTEYKIYVGDRLYEISHTKQRADEIVPILKDMYSEVEVKAVPYKHYASGYERKQLERAIARQLSEYGVEESLKEAVKTNTNSINIEKGSTIKVISIDTPNPITTLYKVVDADISGYPTITVEKASIMKRKG